ncbi:MAG TPA: hypothetical protein VLB84_16065 [Bacteroidia bacterium]|nr:hypothetical protein [Bacteroidia bacterium]
MMTKVTVRHILLFKLCSIHLKNGTSKEFGDVALKTATLLQSKE